MAQVYLVAPAQEFVEREHGPLTAYDETQLHAYCRSIPDMHHPTPVYGITSTEDEQGISAKYLEVKGDGAIPATAPADGGADHRATTPAPAPAPTLALGTLPLTSARDRRLLARNHQQEFAMLCHEDGTRCTEEEMMTQAVALSTSQNDAHGHAAPAADDHAVPTADDRAHSAADGSADPTADGHDPFAAEGRADSIAEAALEAHGCADEEEFLQIAMAMSITTTTADTPTASTPALHLKIHGFPASASLLLSAVLGPRS